MRKTGTSYYFKALLFFEALTFIIASSIHFGILFPGLEHTEAGIAEGIIGGVLILALLVSWIYSRWTIKAVFIAQIFALIGTLIGIFTILIGIGPQTVGDIIYHILIVAVLIWGIFLVRQSDRKAPQNES